MSEQLWTDDMIQDNAMEGYSMRFVLEGQVQVMRNHYQAALDAANERIRQLEEAQEWEPVYGHIHSSDSGDTLTIDGNYLVVNAGQLDNIAIKLPSNIMMMRRRPQPQDGQQGATE